MPEVVPLLPIGCLAEGIWPETLLQADTMLATLGQDTALSAVAYRVARLAATEPEKLKLDLFWFSLGMLLNQAQGHTRLDLDAPGWPEPLQAKLSHYPHLSDLLIRPGLSGLVTCASDDRPFVQEGHWITTQRLRASERILAKVVQLLAAAPVLPCKVPEEILTHPTVLNPEQRQAVELGLGASLALVTGGPGTGKTSIVVALLRAALRLNPNLSMDRILLAAPTGKAAQRLGEAVRNGLRQLSLDGSHAMDLIDAGLLQRGPEPQTLHRALGYHPGLNQFRYREGNPLPAELVIVDEGSMIGLELMEGLVRALRPGTRLVLLGDADQLPSVDPGAVFREFIAGCPERVARLRHSYRMDPQDEHGRHIFLQAMRVNDPVRHGELWGEDGLISHPGLEGLLQQQGVVHVVPESPRNHWMTRFLNQWLEERIWSGLGPKAWLGKVLPPFIHGPEGLSPTEERRAAELLAHFDRFRILCPLNDAPELGGVDSINRYFHARALAAARSALEGQPRFLAGEPVMVLANNASRGLFNGDQGVILPVRRGDGAVHLEVFFPRAAHAVSFPLAAIQDDLSHCYAMTIHKSQGSEFESLAVVLPPREHPALTREILYTALTRAKKQVLLIGTREALEAGYTRSVPRLSGLLERLQKP